MDSWADLGRALARPRRAGRHAPAPGGRLGAVLVLLRDCDDGDLELAYTRRRDDLSRHPGQICFPGGRVDPTETLEQAAVREASEEVGLRPASVELLGRLPPVYIPPSRYWLHGVVARWTAPHPLVGADAEVAEVLHARLSRLLDPDGWRAVRLTARGWSWAWELDDRHLLWGATAVLTATLLDLAAPGWNRGVRADELAAEREARPWELRERPVPVPAPARIPGVPEVPVDALGQASTAAAPGDDAVAAAGEAVADATLRLLAAGRVDRGGGVLVLVGPGGNGAAGVAAAGALRRRGVEVTVRLARPPERLPAAARAGLDALGGSVALFDGALPDAGLVIDAILGAGLRGPLRGEPRRMVQALRHHGGTVLSVDLPSGLHADDGADGDLVAADVTLALAPPRPGLFQAGLGPFVGDLYLRDVGAGAAPDEPEHLVRLVASRPEGWRE